VTPFQLAQQLFQPGNLYLPPQWLIGFDVDKYQMSCWHNQDFFDIHVMKSDFRSLDIASFLLELNPLRNCVSVKELKQEPDVYWTKLVYFFPHKQLNHSIEIMLLDCYSC